MRTRILFLLILMSGIGQFSRAQNNKKSSEMDKVDFTDSNWNLEHKDGNSIVVETMEYKGKKALVLEPGQKAYLKNREFKNFQLEFHCSGQFPGLGFRVQDEKNYEYLYLRVPMGGNEDALQYLPIYNGSLPWQLYNYPKYEGTATFPKEQLVSLSTSFENELVKGNVSKSLITALQKNGLSFSETSLIDFANESTQYIYDPESKKALIIEKSEKGIGFMDLRTWIHTKITVMDKKMDIYIENMQTPAFTVENLKGFSNSGGISLISDFDQTYFSDVSIMEIEGPKSKNPVIDSSKTDNYLTKWRMSEPFAKDSVNFLSQIDSLISHKAKFNTIEADTDGLINISRFHDDMTKTVVLTNKLVVSDDKTITLNFDYADYLVIVLNSKVLFDKGLDFQPPPEKGKEGRVFVDDEQIELKLSKGTNELIFVLSGDIRQKFNWGFIAKLESLDGISIE